MQTERHHSKRYMTSTRYPVMPADVARRIAWRHVDELVSEQRSHEVHQRMPRRRGVGALSAAILLAAVLPIRRVEHEDAIVALKSEG